MVVSGIDCRDGVWRACTLTDSSVCMTASEELKKILSCILEEKADIVLIDSKPNHAAARLIRICSEVGIRCEAVDFIESGSASISIESAGYIIIDRNRIKQSMSGLIGEYFGDTNIIPDEVVICEAARRIYELEL